MRTLLNWGNEWDVIQNPGEPHTGDAVDLGHSRWLPCIDLPCPRTTRCSRYRLITCLYVRYGRVSFTLNLPHERTWHCAISCLWWGVAPTTPHTCCFHPVCFSTWYRSWTVIEKPPYLR